ncbi:hypothetical protein HC766_05430 [Candidatus Gracilibacteria bacterium]|nr:hypothetical protein [Candidatus Gracilibacteria bacterium]
MSDLLKLSGGWNWRLLINAGLAGFGRVIVKDWLSSIPIESWLIVEFVKPVSCGGFSSKSLISSGEYSIFSSGNSGGVLTSSGS